MFRGRIFQKFWLESDSSVVYHSFLDQRLICWSLKGIWHPCLPFRKHMHFKVFHVFCEENHCTDKLSNLPLIHR